MNEYRLRSERDLYRNRCGELQAELRSLRIIAKIKDPEQHFEQIMEANNFLKAELDKAKADKLILKSHPKLK